MAALVRAVGSGGGSDAFLILAGSVVLIFIAAFIEAFFSFYAFPSWSKFLWGTVELVALLGYILGVRAPSSSGARR